MLAAAQPTDVPFEPRFAKFQPFPVECFPEPVRDFVVGQAAGVDCDPAAVAVPVLSVLASAIGGSRRLRLKSAWTEPAVLWTAVVAGTDTSVSGPLRAATMPLSERQEAAFDEYDLAMRHYHKKLADHKTNRVNRNDEQKPEPPIADRFLTTDFRVDALAALVTDRPRGVLACIDDLSGWLGRPNSTSARRALDVADWVRMHSGLPLVRERPNKHPSAVRVCQGTVSFTGSVGIPTLSQKFVKANSPCELTSRILFAQPPTVEGFDLTNDVDDDVRDGYSAVVDELMWLAFEEKPERIAFKPKERKGQQGRKGRQGDAGDTDIGDPAAPPAPNNKYPIANDQSPISSVDETDGLTPAAPKGDKPKEVFTHAPKGFLYPMTRPDGWQDPGETIARLLKGVRIAGYGVTHEEYPPPNAHVPPPPPPAPSFDEVQQVLENLSRPSRRRVEGLANGLGWGMQLNALDVVDFFHRLDDYAVKYGREDPRADSVAERSGRVMASSLGAAPQVLVPGLVDLSAEAKQLFVQFGRDMQREKYDVDDSLTAWFALLPSQAARLALVLHLARWAAGEDVDPAICDETSMRHGLTMARWFAREARRIVDLFSFTAENQEQFKLIDWLQRRGGFATTRDLSRSNGRKYPTADDAESALDRLSETGVGLWVNIPPGPQGGTPYRVFTMSLSAVNGEPEERKTGRGLRAAGQGGKTKKGRGRKAEPRETDEDATAQMAERPMTSSTPRRPAGERWTIEELAAEERERQRE